MVFGVLGGIMGVGEEWWGRRGRELGVRGRDGERCGGGEVYEMGEWLKG